VLTKHRRLHRRGRVARKVRCPRQSAAQTSDSMVLKSAVSSSLRMRPMVGWSCGMEPPSIHKSSIRLPADETRKALMALSCSPSGSG
jgi:hypothetical protein